MRLEGFASQRSNQSPDEVVIGQCHRAKGLEWAGEYETDEDMSRLWAEEMKFYFKKFDENAHTYHEQTKDLPGRSLDRNSIDGFDRLAALIREMLRNAEGLDHRRDSTSVIGIAWDLWR